MKLSKTIICALSVFAVTFFSVLTVVFPEICRDGITRGILLCGRVIIPSLYPFTVCVLFIMNSGVLKKLNFLSFITKKILGLPADLFSVMLLSFIGGYPIGAKLINQAVTQGEISPKEGGEMLNFCINAGPAFIISAVGSGILGSCKLGVVLLVSHILASLIICIFYRFKGGFSSNIYVKSEKKQGIADNFVASASDAAAVTLNICSYVILFSAITVFLEFFSEKICWLRFLTVLSEVTYGVTKTRNIYIISFLLGFSGICIWLQILSTGKKIKINLPLFIFFRILHGILSAVCTYALTSVFKISVDVFSNSRIFSSRIFCSSAPVGFSLLIMAIIFILSLASYKNNSKILEELI